MRKIKRELDTLFGQLQATCTRAAATENSKPQSAIRDALQDYADHRERLSQLLKRETAHERMHRGMAFRNQYPLSVRYGAMALLCHGVAEGSKLSAMPPATNFVIWRDTAAEAWLLGFMLREYLTPEWIKTAAAIDYSKLMQVHDSRDTLCPQCGKSNCNCQSDWANSINAEVKRS